MMLEIGKLDLAEIAEALSDQDDGEHCRLIDPRTGTIEFWTAYTGIDGEHPVDLDDLDLVRIEPLPSWVWYQDMADFAERISDLQATERLARAIQGRGAFRRFRSELHEEYPELLPAWHAWRETRAARRAIGWLAGHGLVDPEVAAGFLAGHPDPELP